MHLKILSAVLLPFLGTVLGSAGVFFLKGSMNKNLQRGLTGFAAGVMVASSPPWMHLPIWASWLSCPPLWVSGAVSCF